MERMVQNNDNLGLDLRPGDNHYRAYVGPPRDYDLISAMVFNLLTCLGLRQHHRVLDIGCGSLRVGRLLIPYLNSENYVGIEPNRWLVEDGFTNEIGWDILKIKKPRFSYRDCMDDFNEPLALDFAVAQSIFSHCGKDLIESWLDQLTRHLKDDGVLLATFLIDSVDFEGNGWVYPGCVKYQPHSIEKMAIQFGFKFQMLDWAHPRQSWGMFSRRDHDMTLVDGGPISWNKAVMQAARS